MRLTQLDVDHLFDGTGEFDPVMECVYADVVFEYARRTAVGPRPRVMVPYLCMLRTQDAKAFFQSRANLVLGDDGSHPDLRDIGIEMDGSDYVEMVSFETRSHKGCRLINDRELMLMATSLSEASLLFATKRPTPSFLTLK